MLVFGINPKVLKQLLVGHACTDTGFCLENGQKGGIYHACRQEVPTGHFIKIDFTSLLKEVAHLLGGSELLGIGPNAHIDGAG